MRNIIFALLFVTASQIESRCQEIPGLYPYTSQRTVADTDIEGKTLAELKIMRNEIFARHGHTFKGEDLKTHFAAQPWYKGTTADALPLLTSLEKQNVDFIKKWETRISNTSEFDSFYKVFTAAVSNNDINKLSDLVIIDFIESTDQFKSSYEIHKDELKAALQNSTASANGDDEYILPYGEFYSGIQYKSLRFKKVGCCWYIWGFVQAG